MRFILFLTCFVLCGYATTAQLRLQLGTHYLAGVQIKKLRVSPEDHTVWALTNDHKVYFKKSSATNFQLYTPVAGQQINDMAGYSFDEMFFAAEPNVLIQVINGVKQNLTIPEPLVTRINALAIIDSTFLSSFSIVNMHSGWLAIGTNDDLYALQKGSSIFKRVGNINPFATPMHSDWPYLRSGFKGATFMSSLPSNNYCTGYSTHTNVNLYGYTNYVSCFDNVPPYPATVNTGLMSLHAMNLTSGATYSYNRTIFFWGTDEGLYGKYLLNCGYKIKYFLKDRINGMDEVYALSQFYPQHYILAATDSGLRYTPATVFPDDKYAMSFGEIQFIPFTGFPAVKATDVLVDSKREGKSSLLVFACDQEAWVSTVDGIYQLGLSYDPEKFKKLTIPNSLFTSGTSPLYNTNGDAVINICDTTQQVIITVPGATHGTVVTKWYKNGIELPQWTGTSIVKPKDAGSYRGEITSLCDGITVRTINYILQSAPEPQISFNYPDKIMTCEGQPVNLTTNSDPSYVYKWYKDGQLILGADTNSYAAISPGRYHVEVSNCGSYYKSSKTVTISNPVLAMPVITANKTSYCQDSIATLAVQTGLTCEIKWYLNGAELTANHNQSTLSTTQAGTYSVSFLQNGCQKNSIPFELYLGPPVFEILKSKEGALCYGEQLTLTASTDAAAYLWSTGETGKTITVSQAGHYTVQLTSASGCVSSQATEVNVLPQATVQPINDTVICTMAAQKVRIYAQHGFSTYNWNGSPSGSSYLDVTQPGHYTLNVTTAEGCTASTMFEVKPWCAEVIIPNAFTPNGDGVNDYWKIGGLERAPSALVQIFNRYGQKVMECRGGSFAWDGRYRGADLPAGTYFYIIQGNSSVTPLKGYVTLIR